MKITSSIFLVVFLTLCFGACKDQKTAEAERNMNEWIGKIIKFPKIAPVIVYKRANDTLNYVISGNKEYKVLLYVDSIGCTICKLNLQVWKTYIEKVNSKVDFLFYFHPKNEKDLRVLFRREQFVYPVYIDNDDEINKLNVFLDNPHYQCFLLNNKNEIISIGNPAINFKVWEVYSQIILGKISAKIPTTIVEAEKTEIELEGLRIGEASTAILVLNNIGEQPLIVKNVQTSCECTVPEWDKQPIKKGKSTKIKVKITPDRQGYFNKTVMIYCNSEKEQIEFIVKGMVNE